MTGTPNTTLLARDAQPRDGEPLNRLAAIWPAVAGVGSLAVAAALVISGRLDELSLLKGPLPPILELFAAMILALSLRGRSSRWWRHGLPITVAVSVAVVLAAAASLRWTGTLRDQYPNWFLLWAAEAIFALAALPQGARRTTHGQWWLRAVAIPLTALSALLLVNGEYGYWPTLGALLGKPLAGQVTPALLERRIAVAPQPRSAPLEKKGVYAPFDPPATISRFHHRTGGIYLPPAYTTTARSSLPVIIMLGGVPGSPAAWPHGGYAVATANEYAAQHQGFAPVLVFLDQNGSATGDTECVDSSRGRAETYLSVDAPLYIAKHLGIPVNPRTWTIAGFSEGGTCAIDLALRHPNIWGSFLDFAGDLAPNVGSHRETLRTLFDGSTQRMAEHYPLRLMKLHRYDGGSACFVAGSADPLHYALMQTQQIEAKKAGFRAHVYLFPSEGHTWSFAAKAFRQCLPQLLRDESIR